LDSSIKFKHVGIENTPYDGVVKIEDQYNRLEITYLYLGKYASDQQKKIIEDGAAWSYRDAEEIYIQIEKVILDTARKKAAKTNKNTLLVLYYASGEDLYPGDEGMDEETFEALIEKLQGIRYRAKRVHFFVPQIEYVNASGQQTKPERLYRIK